MSGRPTLLALMLLGCADVRQGVPDRTRGATEIPDPAIPVRFAWSRHDGGRSGEITADVPDGEAFRGEFVQLDRADEGAGIGGFRNRWNAGFQTDDDAVLAEPPLYESTDGRRQPGHAVVARLRGDRGTHMQCEFTLADPTAGLERGATGRCTLSNGKRIVAQFGHE